MAKFLLKTEPSVYSYFDLERDKKTVWDGVTNNLALKHIRSMQKGDLVFIYHTGDEKQIVGIATLISPPYPDPKKNDGKFFVFELQPKERLKKVVTLAEIILKKEFEQFPLVRIARLSVMPVTEEEWKQIVQISKT